MLWAGQPVAGAIVSTPNGTNTAQAITAADGTYVLRNLAPTTSYTVTCSKTGSHLHSPVHRSPAPRLRLRLRRGLLRKSTSLRRLTVSGQVTDPVNGIAGAEVRGGGMVTTTDASGNYQFTNFLEWHLTR